MQITIKIHAFVSKLLDTRYACECMRIIGARLSEPHIRELSVCEIYVHIVRPYVARAPPHTYYISHRGRMQCLLFAFFLDKQKYATTWHVLEIICILELCFNSYHGFNE